jgi:hypothetical protein
VSELLTLIGESRIVTRHPGEAIARDIHVGVVKSSTSPILGMACDYYFRAATTSITDVHAKRPNVVVLALNGVAYLRLGEHFSL